jgi:hypothetical protein
LTGRPHRQVWIGIHLWICVLIVHVGSSYGQSRWGDVAAGMGGVNVPYLDAFLLRPYYPVLWNLMNTN